MAYRDTKHFVDRELSWLAFNKRVLEEAQDPATPLFERLKFLGIVATNLDEFFMVRVSGVQDQIFSGVRRRTPAGLSPSEQFNLIHQEAHAQVDALYDCFREEIVPRLADERILIMHPSSLSRKMQKHTRELYAKEIFPVLTPLAVDSGHPFPRLKGLSLNVIVHLEGSKRVRSGEPMIAIVQVPSVLPRLIEIPPTQGRRRFVLLEDLIIENLSSLFPGLKVKEAVPFRVTRDADIEYKEIDAEDLLKYIETEIRERERGMAVRLQIGHKASELLTGYLMRMLGLNDLQVYRVNGPIAVSELSVIWGLDSYDHLKVAPFQPNIRKNLRRHGSMFSRIRRQDILLHHPFESFAPIVDFIRDAANDPQVLAIKQTLYRTSGDSPIIKSLIRAAENGKQVTALVELKARFDEENNIVWARQLEEAGVHVVYGLVGLKTHCKVALVVRKEGDAIRRYVHMGTGNYNPSTAKLYTDLGMFTCDQGFCEDASELFNMLTGYSHSPRWQRIIVAPEHLREKTTALIAAEREKAERGKPARIRAKMNSLVDPDIIVELYRASRAGVQIDINIRGICCLRPGIKGISENIRIWSIVDRFLEHSRIFIFGEDPDTKVFLSSADWMDRNMDRRIEVMFPVNNADLKNRLINEIFASCQKDNVKARYMNSDGKYRRPKLRSGEQPFRSQEELLMVEAVESSGEKWEGALPPEELASELSKRHKGGRRTTSKSKGKRAQRTPKVKKETAASKAKELPKEKAAETAAQQNSTTNAK
ncbi:polyphosphate kinase 1 [bacterium]|nr:polyphosphate kinase 1 [bacterium]